jgi:alpha-1,3-rhamnosyl/mannosyltransferase
LPVIEAMKSGVPVITGNLTALPGVVGDNGVMVDPRDTDAIAGALLRLIDDAERRAELAALGLKHSRRFSWQRAAELTLEVLAEAAG